MVSAHATYLSLLSAFFLGKCFFLLRLLNHHRHVIILLFVPYIRCGVLKRGHFRRRCARNGHRSRPGNTDDRQKMQDLARE
ncbi:hypothetical protein BDV40DRAFT_173257 [Aspergillus tamarii]|uniref:Uncharacterized protein n=1 Tax=Aspergillus tamarii TaxID=41984 RepID=A0A5N6UT77_ASPTM|nr:hypothetical protein BDV40DRAFT_173257 [Aspergillus tamarii]